jgi:hypothetical protein
MPKKKKKPTKDGQATKDPKWEKDYAGSRNGRGFGADGSWDGPKQDDTATPDGGVDEKRPDKDPSQGRD